MNLGLKFLEEKLFLTKKHLHLPSAKCLTTMWKSTEMFPQRLSICHRIEPDVGSMVKKRLCTSAVAMLKATRKRHKFFTLFQKQVAFFL